jgi:CopG family nickel-responsive transcriptional regulator
MGDLSRIGVAIDSDLLAKFDQHIQQKSYHNRSEAFRDLIRDALIEETAEHPDSIVVGTLTLVYDHHVRLLSDRLTAMQHDHFHLVLSTLHVHLDHNNCLEVLILKGKAAAVQKMADALISTKGVMHGRLTITSPGAGS